MKIEIQTDSMKLVRTFLLTVTLISRATVFAQVGVDNTNPHPSSVFDLQSTDKGILIPRMTSAERQAIASPAQSLLVFDTTVGKFYYFNGATWNTLESWNSIAGGISYTGQVAVNTTSPHASSALDLTSTTKGVLIPRMTSAQRLAILSPAASLLVFDTTEGIFYFYTGSQWATLNSFVQNSGNTTATHNGDIIVNGTITATSYAGLNVTGTVPSGGIIMWSGSVASIPTGWVLCDGRLINGAPIPDLRDKFVVGAGSGYLPGNTGGSNSVTLSTSQLPAHSHTYKDRFAIENAGITTWPTGYLTESAGSNKRGDQSDTDNDEFIYLNKTTETTGSGAAIENRPPFYALAFIMKL